MENSDTSIQESSTTTDSDTLLLVDNSNLELPPKPDEPLPSDCCGSGCSPCVFDIYEVQLNAWKLECLKMKRNLELFKSSVLSPICYSEFVCTSAKHHATNVRMFTFQPACGPIELNLKPGEYLVLQNGNQQSLSRAFTPLPSDSFGSFNIVAKIYPHGCMSKYLEKISVGSIVHWKGPYTGVFTYRPNSFKHIVMFCAGTGVAPAYSLCCSVTADENDYTFLQLIVSYHDASSFILREELFKLSESWNFTYKVYLTKQTAISTHYGEKVVFQRINAEIVDAELCQTSKDNLLVIICGTKSFNKEIAGYVKGCGIEHVCVL